MNQDEINKAFADIEKHDVKVSVVIFLRERLVYRTKKDGTTEVLDLDEEGQGPDLRERHGLLLRSLQGFNQSVA